MYLWSIIGLSVARIMLELGISFPKLKVSTHNKHAFDFECSSSNFCDATYISILIL